MKQKIRVYPVAIQAEGTKDFSGVYALGVLMSYAKFYQQGALKEHFIFDDIVILEESDIINKINEFDDIPTVFLCSCYIWSEEKNLAFAKEVKRLLPNSLVVFGGANIPKDEKKCKKMMMQHHCIDVAVRGEGEETLAELLTCLSEEYLKSPDKGIRFLDFSTVKGITFKQQDLTFVRTEERDRIKSFSGMPSPYMTGEFCSLKEVPEMAILETNRGCPFGCTFCDWGGKTLAKIHKFDLERVFEEIEYIGERGYAFVTVADANFGVFDRDIEIVNKLVEVKKKLGFPKSVVLSLAKNVTKRYKEIVSILAEHDMLNQAVASLQTTDQLTLEQVDRSNIKKSAYIEMIDIFHQLEINSATDILIGLPGQTYQTFKTDLQFCFDRRIEPRVSVVMVLVNSPMAEDEYIDKYKIEVNNKDQTIKSTYSSSEDDIKEMKKLTLMYYFFIEEKVLFYYLQYLQAEHGINALDFILKWNELSVKSENKYPQSYKLNKSIFNEVNLLGSLGLKWNNNAGAIFRDIKSFYNEIVLMTETMFSVKLNKKEVQCLVDFQSFLMPSPDKVIPYYGDFSFNLTDYFKQFYILNKGALDLKNDKYYKLEEFEENINLCVPKENNEIRKNFSYCRGVYNKPSWALNLAVK